MQHPIHLAASMIVRPFSAVREPERRELLRASRRFCLRESPPSWQARSLSASVYRRPIRRTGRMPVRRRRPRRCRKAPPNRECRRESPEDPIAAASDRRFASARRPHAARAAGPRCSQSWRKLRPQSDRRCSPAPRGRFHFGPSCGTCPSALRGPDCPNRARPVRKRRARGASDRRDSPALPAPLSRRDPRSGARRPSAS